MSRPRAGARGVVSRGGWALASGAVRALRLRRAAGVCGSVAPTRASLDRAEDGRRSDRASPPWPKHGRSGWSADERIFETGAHRLQDERRCARRAARAFRGLLVATPRSTRSVTESAATPAPVATATASRRPHCRPSWRSARPVSVLGYAPRPRPRSGSGCGVGSNCTAHG